MKKAKKLCLLRLNAFFTVYYFEKLFETYF